MASLICVATIAEQALGAATAETVLQIVAPTNQRVKVLGWGVFFDGTSVTAEPVQVILTRQTGAGTSSANTPVRLDGSLSETIQTTARDTFTAEPTSDDATIDVVEVHPQQGYEKLYPLGQEPIIDGGGRLGIKCTAPAAVNCRAKIIFEE